MSLQASIARHRPRAASSPAEVEPYVVPPSQEFNGNDGSWSTFKINVGGQEMRVLASTKSGETYVIAPDGCTDPRDPSDCPQLRGAGLLNNAQSSGFQSNASSTWSSIGQFEINLEKNVGYAGRGEYGYDTVSLGPASSSASVSMDKQVVVGVGSLDYWIGHIPLGTPESSFCTSCEADKSLLWQLRDNSKIPSLSFAYTAGAKYRSKSPFGQLILGGYDTTRFKPNQNDFSFSFSTNPTQLLTVGVQSIQSTNTPKGSYTFSSKAHFSLVDSTVPHLWLPREICDEFEDVFGLTYDPEKDLYLVNDTMHDQLTSLKPEITIKLGNSLENHPQNHTSVVLPYSAFDLQASYPYYNKSTNYFPIRRAANDSQYVLGRTLLQEAYLVVDYERSNFSISQATYADPAPPANLVTISPPSTSESSSSGLSSGAIAGIVIGIVAVLIGIAVAVILFLRRRRNQSRKDAASRDMNLKNQNEGHANELDSEFSERRRHDQPTELASEDVEELVPSQYKFRGAYGQSTSGLSSPVMPQELSEQTFTPAVELPSSTQYYEMEGDMGTKERKGV
ncbi:unnamed protein product [Periconia digitata]|uniref:Peptidase A1 domain-containing protein n=1 Tax=Periconia digitata TaxID=1303443 RepID=A0A9W4U347_9PLEO|nr:unnamed protein product [Periconia digitata]